jgi:hypothetical protein
MCLWVNDKKKWEFFFFIFKVTEEDSDTDSLVRGADSDPHQNVMDPQHCLLSIKNSHSDVYIKAVLPMVRIILRIWFLRT